MTADISLLEADDELENGSRLGESFQGVENAPSDFLLTASANTAVDEMMTAYFMVQQMEDASSDPAITTIAELSDAEGRVDVGRPARNTRLLELVNTLETLPDEKQDERWWSEFDEFIRSNRPSFRRQ